MKRRRGIVLFSIGLCALGALYPVTAQQPPGTFESEVLPLLTKNCVSCHGGANPEADLSLEAWVSNGQAIQAPEVWAKVARKLVAGQMPPKGSPRPDPQMISRALAWITQLEAKAGNGGRVTMHRLNRTEYVNTVRDLLDVEVTNSDDFPNDDVGYGFDNIGDVLSVSPLLLEKYLQSALSLASRAIMAPGGTIFHLSADAFKPDGAFRGWVTPVYSENGGVMLYSFGEVATDQTFPVTGTYTIVLNGSGTQAGPDPCRAGVIVDGTEVAAEWVPEVYPSVANYTFQVPITAGRHHLGIAFENDYYEPTNPDPNRRDRNLFVNSVDVQLPVLMDPGSLPRSHRSVIFRRLLTDEDSRLVLKAFARRAYRRPATAAEINQLMRFVKAAHDQGDPPERGIQMAVAACLMSPNFLFRPEIDANPINPRPRLLNGYELASRLSYFLWSSMPDEELMERAEDGSLLEPDVQTREVARMLVDRRANALADSFAAQWLTLRKLATVTPDRSRFPEFDDGLRHDMQTETLMFFMNLVKTDRPVLDLLNGKYTFVNNRLAKLYGLPEVTGDRFRQVSLEGTPRSGVITQASVMTVTSNPSRTSPVKRGKWLLEEILGTPTPPPPPGVGVLTEDAAASQPKTLRLRLEAHRAKPQCAVCHNRIDPLGFGLENFDPIGRWRDAVDGTPVDAGGKLPDGRIFTGPQELVGILMGQKDLFVRNLADKMLTYALGRGTEPDDDAALDAITQQTAQGDYHFSKMIDAIVTSKPFRTTAEGGGN